MEPGFRDYWAKGMVPCPHRGGVRRFLEPRNPSIQVLLDHAGLTVFDKADGNCSGRVTLAVRATGGGKAVFDGKIIFLDDRLVQKEGGVFKSFQPLVEGLSDFFQVKSLARSGKDHVGMQRRQKSFAVPGGPRPELDEDNVQHFLAFGRRRGSPARSAPNRQSAKPTKAKLSFFKTIKQKTLKLEMIANGKLPVARKFAGNEIRSGERCGRGTPVKLIR